MVDGDAMCQRDALDERLLAEVTSQKGGVVAEAKNLRLPELK